MKRHVVAGMLGLALAGCAQERTAQTRPASGVGPVSLGSEMPSIRETVNRGFPPSQAVAKLAGDPSLNSTGWKVPTGRPALVADENAGKPRPQIASSTAPNSASTPVASEAAEATPAAETPGNNSTATAVTAVPSAAAVDMTAAPNAWPGTPAAAAVPQPTTAANEPAPAQAPGSVTPSDEGPAGPSAFQPPRVAAAPSELPGGSEPKAQDPAAAPAQPAEAAATSATPTPTDDPLLGANPNVMPAMDNVPAARTADETAGAKDTAGQAAASPAPDQAPAETTAAQPSSPDPAPAAGRDPLLGDHPDVMPAIGGPAQESASRSKEAAPTASTSKPAAPPTEAAPAPATGASAKPTDSAATLTSGPPVIYRGMPGTNPEDASPRPALPDPMPAKEATESASPSGATDAKPETTAPADPAKAEPSAPTPLPEIGSAPPVPAELPHASDTAPTPPNAGGLPPLPPMEMPPADQTTPAPAPAEPAKVSSAPTAADPALPPLSQSPAPESTPAPSGPSEITAAPPSLPPTAPPGGAPAAELPPVAPSQPPAAQSMLGQNPDVMPKIEMPADPAPAAGAAPEAGKPAAPANAPPTAASTPEPGPAAPPASRPLLGEKPDVMPAMKIPASPEPATASPATPAPLPPANPPGDAPMPAPAQPTATEPVQPAPAPVPVTPAPVQPAPVSTLSTPAPLPTSGPGVEAPTTTVQPAAPEPLQPAPVPATPVTPPASDPGPAPSTTSIPPTAPEPVMPAPAPVPAAPVQPEAAASRTVQDPAATLASARIPQPQPSVATTPVVDPAVVPVSMEPTKVRSDLKPRDMKEAGLIAARIGSDVITIHDLGIAMREQLKKKKISGRELSPKDVNKIAESILNDMIDRKLILQEIKRRLKKPEQLEAVTAMADKSWRERELPPLLRAYNVTNEYELKQKLKEKGDSIDDKIQAYRDEFLSNGFVSQELGSRTSIDLNEMREYYNAHLSDYEHPSQVTWREVVIDLNKAPNRAEARKRADAVLARLRRGEDFAAVARAESDGPNRKAGGLWERMSTGSYIVPEVNDALNSLPLNQVSQIIETSDGYHVILVEERRPAGPSRFDEVQDSVRMKLTRQKFDHEMNDYLDKLRSRTSVVKITRF